MSEQYGKLVSCTRCPTSIFLKQTGEVGLSNYSGPGTRFTYEDLPKTWMHVTSIGHLCPSCSKDLRRFLVEFLGEEEYEKLAPCWKIEEEK